MTELSEEQLTDVWNAILDDKIEILFWIYLHDLEIHHDYTIVYAKYNGKDLYFQNRDDWGVILGSIELREIHDETPKM